MNEIPIQSGPAEIWSILPDHLARWLTDISISLAAAADSRLAVTRPGPKSGRVARLPIMGGITRRSSFWSSLLGGTTVEGLLQAMRELEADPTVGAVLLDVDSPGGTVSGLPELAAGVRKLRESKTVIALANSLMASAAYWVASQADEIIATPEALVGSIGVFATHFDVSAMMERIGVKVSYIYAGKYKIEGNEDEPLTDDAREHLQSLIDHTYNLFVSDVAKGRGISPAAVKSDYGQGRVLSASEAKTAGLIDRVSSFGDTLQRLGGMKAEEGGNSRTLAHLRRRLELAEKT
jgi:signal peptide peptidase SppA